MSLQRIADSNTEKSAEVKEGRRTEWVDIVGVIEGVEYFGPWNKFVSVMELEGPGKTKVQNEEGVVFAKMVAAAVDSVDKACKRVVGAAGRASAGA